MRELKTAEEGEGGDAMGLDDNVSTATAAFTATIAPSIASDTHIPAALESGLMLQ